MPMSETPSSAEGAVGGEGVATEKEEVIGRILELQNTLHDLSQRVNSVKEENAKLKAENQVQYNLMYTLYRSLYSHHGIGGHDITI